MRQKAYTGLRRFTLSTNVEIAYDLILNCTIGGNYVIHKSLHCTDALQLDVADRCMEGTTHCRAKVGDGGA